MVSLFILLFHGYSFLFYETLINIISKLGSKITLPLLNKKNVNRSKC